MKKSEIIHILRDPVKAAMTKMGKDNVSLTYASRFMAQVLYAYDNGYVNDEDIKYKNNPLGLKDPATGEHQSFNTLEECVLHSIAIDTGDSTEEMESELASICKANNLYRFDKEFINSTKGPVIDLTEEEAKPNFDQYTVKDSQESEIMKTMNLEEAQQAAEAVTHKPAKIYNSRGIIVSGGKENKGKKSNVILNTALQAGTLISANNLNLYKNITDTFPSRAVTGNLYIYSTKKEHNRYAVCANPELVNNHQPSVILGYVNAADIGV